MKNISSLRGKWSILSLFLEFYIREAQREANEEAKAEYNPAAYGMNRTEEYSGYSGNLPGNLSGQTVIGPSGAAPQPVVAPAPDQRYTDTRRISPNR